MVIQRLQNLYLLVAALLVTMYAFMESVIIKVGASVYSIDCLKMSIAPEGLMSCRPVSMVLTILSVLLIVLSIAKFKDLKAQKGSVRISVLINMALVAYVYLNASVMAKELGGELACSWVAVLPIAAIVLQFMAFRAVKRDIKLLSDSDRIR